MAARHEDVDPVVADLIRRKARRLARSLGFSPSDEDDLRQDLWLHVVAGMQRYDATRASCRTFATRIVTTRSISMAQHTRAQKRDRRRERCIDSLVEPPADGRELTLEQVDLRTDVGGVVASLPVDLHPIAILYMRHGGDAGVIRASGLSRQRVRGLRRRLTEHLQVLV